MMDMPDFFEAYDRDRYERTKKLPICESCGETIQDDYYFEDVNGLDVVCEDCLIREYRKAVDDFVS